MKLEALTEQRLSLLTQQLLDSQERESTLKRLQDKTLQAL